MPPAPDRSATARQRAIPVLVCVSEGDVPPGGSARGIVEQWDLLNVQPVNRRLPSIRDRLNELILSPRSPSG